MGREGIKQVRAAAGKWEREGNEHDLMMGASRKKRAEGRRDIQRVDCKPRSSSERDCLAINRMRLVGACIARRGIVNPKARRMNQHRHSPLSRAAHPLTASSTLCTPLPISHRTPVLVPPFALDCSASHSTLRHGSSFVGDLVTLFRLFSPACLPTPFGTVATARMLIHVVPRHTP